VVAVPDLPSITIITPSFNAAGTIAETLESVRAQAYPGLEHIVVDGGSTDGTLELLDAAPEIRYVSEPDRGLAHALNKGIAMTSTSPAASQRLVRRSVTIPPLPG
jgi:glycosyltransferase involved in cell wall biosynthesis